SLSWEPADQMQQIWHIDPLAPVPPLPIPVHQRYSNGAQLAFQRAARRAEKERQPLAPQVVRTALAIEARDGRLHVFLPPMNSTEDFVELLVPIEDTAANLSMPVLIEGYPPPFDSRLSNIKVTPDPGVIEVNVHPSRSWRDLIANTTTLYEQA